MLTNFINTLHEIQNNSYRITQMTNGKEAIQQTERNTIKANLCSALHADLSTLFPISDENGKISAYYIDGDIVLEVPNESIADKVTTVDGSGAISLTLSVKVNGLDFDAKNASEDYAAKVAEKEAKKRAEAEKKAKKIAKDKALREAKAKLKAEAETLK